jgi:hypothetical protein
MTALSSLIRRAPARIVLAVVCAAMITVLVTGWLITSNRYGLFVKWSDGEMNLQPTPALNTR